MSNNQVLIDVMVGDRFFCQLRYNGSPFPKMINGEVAFVYDDRDIKRFIEEKRPSLIGKNYRYEQATQKVFRR